MKVFVSFCLAALFISSAATADIKIASWNIYWLGDGEGRDQSPRQDGDYSRLRSYASLLAADIVAVQEVENQVALQIVFPASEYNIEMAEQGIDQRTGFAIRKGIQYRRLPDYKPLATSQGMRVGTVIEVTMNDQPITLMAVHMKSGCFEADLDAPEDNTSCDKLARQIPHLNDWMLEAEQAGMKFIVLGDFNRRMNKPDDDLWRMIGHSGRVRVSEGYTPQCYGGKFREYIDHIIVSGSLAPAVKPMSFQELTFKEPYSAHKSISDHCPVSFTLND